MRTRPVDLDSIARDYSALYPGIEDRERRERKGRKVASIIGETVAGKAIGVILDVGCSNAILLDTVSRELGPRLALGVDMDSRALPVPTDLRKCVAGSGLYLPVRTESVDVVICNHTYEHVPDAETLLDEIHRVLKRGGIAYLGAMNASWPVEPHYKVPFLHMMPDRMSRPIMRLMGYPWGYLEKPLGLKELRKLVEGFEIKDYTLSAIADPDRYHARDVVPDLHRKRLVVLLSRAFYRFLPGYLWVLEKKQEDASRSGPPR